MTVDNGILTGIRRVPVAATEAFIVVEAGPPEIDAYRRLRREVFVREQGLFEGHDRDDADDDPRTVVLVARTTDGEVLGGVRLHPAPHASTAGRDIGWWRGSRLAVLPAARHGVGVGAALVRAACARAEAAGALRFDAQVQARHAALFTRLGWEVRGDVDLLGQPHVLVDWPIGRVQRLATATKAPLGALLAGLDGPAGFRGDDGVPVPGSDLVAACDAILPSMVERDPEWAGWCAALVNLNDLTAMGAAPVGLLDAVGARDASFAQRIVAGLRSAVQAWEVPVLGGHTQLGVPAALSVTALGRTSRPVPGGGASPGEALRLTADLGGGWRPGYTGAQWDSSSHRTGEQLRALGGVVGSLAPTAAKDVSMSGLVGSTGMLAEASGVRALVDVERVPTPRGATHGDWFTCFPGFAMVTTDRPTADAGDLPGFVTSEVCGEITAGAGVGLRWPDGVVTEAVRGPVTGMGAA
ncbi:MULTISPECIES: MSMEG_0567/sll0787 family protein [unclassified Aeromicrobium]|uniref:MSMEG_0567/sll0787 family protein n=1 Tax=unclassified Aeromicrobium TaxID=2633570 RepID=UPI0006FD9F98|nr:MULTISPECIES: MSMEG_0567/sll0787 family protein [unclassified Aeromicrobium]KQO39165.1 AIR synthase [Aeromicrobium sp. Leaf245]KQP82431.1 AIR synthase [Aeromicrobium sp. Leaf291]